MVTFPFFTSKPYIQDFVGQFEGSCQRIVIGSTVLCHIHRYRQTRSWSKEAGGRVAGACTVKMASKNDGKRCGGAVAGEGWGEASARGIHMRSGCQRHLGRISTR